MEKSSLFPGGSGKPWWRAMGYFEMSNLGISRVIYQVTLQQQFVTIRSVSGI